jgi:hypothetical protein
VPDSIFDGFVVLDSSHQEGGLIHLRFVPQFFEVGHTDPVLSIDIRSHVEAGEASGKIAMIRQSCITDICVDPQTLEVWLGNEGHRVIFQGSVTWSYEAYTLSDYAKAMERQGHAAGGKIRHLRGILERAISFVDRAIDRAERKEGAGTAGSDRFAKEAQLLRSVRRQLTDD